MTQDNDKFTGFPVPPEFRGVGFLIAELKFRHQAVVVAPPTEVCEVTRRSITQVEGEREVILRKHFTVDVVIANSDGWGNFCDRILGVLSHVMSERYPSRAEATGTTVEKLNKGPLQEVRVLLASGGAFSNWGPGGPGLEEAICMNHVWAVFANSLVDAFESLFEESARMRKS